MDDKTHDVVTNADGSKDLVPKGAGPVLPNDDPLAGLYAADRSACASHVDVEGRRFYVRMWSAESKQLEATQHLRAAQAAGLSLTEYEDKSKPRSNAQNTAIEAVLNADREAYIRDCIMGIGLTIGPTAQPGGMIVKPVEEILMLRPDVIRTLSDYIVGFCRFGVGQKEFFRSRDGAAV